MTDDGDPRVIPTIHVRVGDTLYVHGSAASRTLRAHRATGGTVCIEATLIDGLVLARSTPNHSMNYRSVVVYGTPREVTDPAERDAAQRALVEHVVPGRTADVRMPSGPELKETAIFAITLDEASAKIRTGPPVDPVGRPRLARVGRASCPVRTDGTATPSPRPTSRPASSPRATPPATADPGTRGLTA